MKVSSQFATSHFEELLDAVDRGEEVEILRAGKPGLHLVPNGDSVAEPTKKEGGERIPGAGRGELLGAWEGKLSLPSDEEWRAMDREIEVEMLKGPIFPLEPR